MARTSLMELRSLYQGGIDGNQLRQYRGGKTAAGQRRSILVASAATDCQGTALKHLDMVRVIRMPHRYVIVDAYLQAKHWTVVSWLSDNPWNTLPGSFDVVIIEIGVHCKMLLILHYLVVLAEVLLEFRLDNILKKNITDQMYVIYPYLLHNCYVT